jgi:CheY-like chemotaxis protein
MGGLEAFREMRRIDADVAIILTSGYAEEDARARLAHEGLSGFLQKPYQVGALIGMIRDLIEESAAQ